MKKKVIGIRVVHNVELNHPMEEDLENLSPELNDITERIFVGVDNLVCELGQNHKSAVAGYIYEGEEF